MTYAKIACRSHRPAFQLAAALAVLMLAASGLVQAEDKADAVQVIPAPVLAAAEGASKPEGKSKQPVAPAPATACSGAGCAGGCACSASGCGSLLAGPCAGDFSWSKVPPLTVFPLPGNFIVPPTGPGYYSLCDLIQGNCRETPPKLAYPPLSIDPKSFFENDFRYLDDPANTRHDYLDPLKRIHIGDNLLLSFGGEERFRWANEMDSRLSGHDNDYDLVRSRLYMDVWFRDLVRVYVEMLDAHSYNQDLPPVVIDQDHPDLLNLFADVRLGELADNPVYFRIGRQELCYGSQRLISALDWANTRRTFQGIKGFWHSEDLDVDAFWVQPVIPSPGHFDSVDDKQGFAGLWNTYRPYKGQAVDLYYLYLDNTNPLFTGRYSAVGGYNVSTFGSRYGGEYCHVLFDVEGMYQFGDWVNQSISAGSYTTGLGYHLAKLPMNPQFWVYHDWASGDHSPGASNEHGTFNQLFPFGHYYFGFIDVVGRENIDDWNFHFYCNPDKWITTGFQYHIFRLDSAKDALYNAGGAPIRKDPTGLSGTDVGDEIDVTTNFHLSVHQDILVGYSKLFAGEFIRHTGPPGSPELFYLQYSYRW